MPKFVVIKTYEVSEVIEAESENEAINKFVESERAIKMIKIKVKKFDGE